MSTVTKQKITFLSNWTPDQFKVMNNAIAYYFKNKELRTSHGNHFLGYSFKKVDSILGLAYTSTGVWACYGVCNTEPYFDMNNIYQYSYFVMDQHNLCYAILQDKDENELIIPL